jgi:hypothetical protein
MKKKCEVCNKEFIASKNPRQRACSKECGYKIRVLKPNSGQFKKGNRPSIATEFKKGEFSGENHPRWKGGKRINYHGYVVIYSPEHPRAYRNEMLEHIVVAEKKLGRYLKKGECVHHINRIKHDNSPENLIVFGSNSEHIKEHNMKTWSKKNEKCINCGTTERKHEGIGMCERCYKKYKYRTKKCQ